MRKRWLWISILVGTLALGALATGAAVLAQGDGEGDGSTTEPPAKQSFASRVAAILELDETTVQSAFDQVKREVQDERLENKLTRLVALGKLTEAQKQEYLDWYRSRPEGPLAGPLFSGPGKHSKAGKFRFSSRHGGRFHNKFMPPPDNPDGGTSY